MEPTLNHKLALRLITSIQARIEKKSQPHFLIRFFLIGGKGYIKWIKCLGIQSGSLEIPKL